VAGAAGKATLNIDAKEFQTVLRHAKQFDPELVKALRRQFRLVGDKAAKAVRAEVLKPPDNHKGRTRTRTTLGATKRRPATKIKRGLRQAMARGIKVTVKAPNKGLVGVYIVSSGGNDPAGKLLKRKWDSDKGWRHPVFARGKKSVSLRDAMMNKKTGKSPGQAEVWVDQFGHPYFVTVLQRFGPEMGVGVRKALDQATKVMTSGKKSNVYSFK